ncbi:MAG: hypothetical protein ACIAS6_13125 [Phycisphaerales bacterium JB060]
MSQMPPSQPPTQPGPIQAEPTAVRTAILLSAIFNILAAVSWAWTCIGIVLSVPLVILAVFEILHFNALGQPPYGPKRPRAQLLGILEICTILAGNLPSVVCGIIVLAFLDKVRD